MEGHVVITGATGLIGAEVARRLIAEGRQVVVFARSPASASAKIPGAAAYEQWDSDMESGPWVRHIDGASAVIHLAGKPLLEERWTEQHKVACYDSRIKSTRALVSAMTNAGKKPETFISSSAIGYYGSFDRCDDTPELTESGAAGHDFLAKICMDWEREAIPAEKLGVRVVLLRTGIVLSTQGGMLQKLLTPFSMFVGGPVGSGNQCLSWIHFDDEVNVILNALNDRAYRGPVNAVGPNPVSMKDFASTLGAVLGRPSLLPVPKFAVQILMGEGADYAVKGQLVTPAVLLEHHFAFAYPKLFDALKDLVSHNK